MRRNEVSKPLRRHHDYHRCVDRYQLLLYCTNSLARAEIFITLATFFRRFDKIELYKTTREDDIDMKHDLFLPRPKNLDSVGVQVMLK